MVEWEDFHNYKPGANSNLSYPISAPLSNLIFWSFVLISTTYKKKRKTDNCEHYKNTKNMTVLIHVQYCDIMRFMVLHNRHHKVSQSVPFFMHCKTVTILLRIRVRGHFVMSITNNHESHYVTVLHNPHCAMHFLEDRRLGSILNTAQSV